MAAVPGTLDQSESDVVRSALQDEYEIIEELGRGGMAIVYRARDRNLDREVAIKVLPFSLTFDAEFVERFQREARTAAKLEHPNIIPIYRVGRTGRVIFFIMKFLRGQSLSEQIERRGVLPPEEIRRFLTQTASALGYAHRHQDNIVHRDIKPDNIMFDESGIAILTDFGIAKAASGTRLTGTGMSIGTPHYMSPEQARAQPLDGRSDIYSLGVVSYQCLIGRVPFDGEDSFAIGYKHIMEELPEPPLPTAEHRRLFEVVRRMLAKSPDDRFQTAEELVAALEGTREQEAPGSMTAETPAARTAPPRPVMRRPRTVPRGASATTPTTPLPGSRSRRTIVGESGGRKRSGVLVGMLMLLLIGGGGASGYWYFFLNAQWPLPFVAQRGEPISMLLDSATLGTGDSTALVPSDSTVALADSMTADDSSVAAVEDPATPLPNTGTLVISGLPQGAQLSVDGDSAAGDSLELDAGSHVVVAERLGYERLQRTVQIRRGEVTRLEVAMARVAQPSEATPPAPRRVEPQPNSALCAQEPPSVDYFRSRACYDTPPSTRGAPIIHISRSVEQAPDPVELLVKVSADGSASRILRGRRVAGSQYALTAVQFARDSLRYNPALKNGRPIDAWLRVRVVFRRQ